MSCLLASCVCLCAESKTNKNYICIYIWETTSSGSWNTLHLCLQITVLRIVCKLQEHRCTWKAPAARQPQKKQAQAQDQSSWRSKNKICTHCLFTTDLISSEYKQSNSVITKYLGCKMKLLKDWKCSTGVTTLSTALWDGHIQNAVLALSPLHFWVSQAKGRELEFFLIVALAKFHQKK